MVEPYTLVPLDQLVVADHESRPLPGRVFDGPTDARHELGVAVTSRRVLAMLAARDVHDPSGDVGGVVTDEPRDDAGDVHGIEVEPCGRWRLFETSLRSCACARPVTPR